MRNSAFVIVTGVNIRPIRKELLYQFNSFVATLGSILKRGQAASAALSSAPTTRPLKVTVHAPRVDTNLRFDEYLGDLQVAKVCGNMEQCPSSVIPCMDQAFASIFQ